MKRHLIKMSLAAACATVAATAVSVGLAQSSQRKVNTTNQMGLAHGHRNIWAGTAKLPVASPEVMARVEALMEQGNQMEKQAHAQMEAGDLAGAEQTTRQAIAYYETPRPEFHAPLLQFAARPRQTLGDIYLQGGHYQEALQTYGVVGKYTRGEGAVMGPTLHLNVALAYCGLGDYESARHYYSDEAITQYSFGGKKVDPADLPGTDTPQNLKASILLARGIDSDFHEENVDAVRDFTEAGQLTPDNALLNYYWSDVLSRLNHHAEAAPHARIAAAHAHGVLVEFANHRRSDANYLEGFVAKHPDYAANHPEWAPKPLK